MNKKESAIISAFTGISFGGELFSAFHQYAEHKFERPIWTHEMADPNFWEKLKNLSEQDFIDLAQNITD